jgi:hypothetical protein
MSSTQITEQVSNRAEPRPLADWLAQAAPWLLFLAILAWGWRAWDLVHAVPAYEDTLEVLWIARWYADALHGLHGVRLYPLTFYPAGWHITTYGEGPSMLLLLLPLYWLGGAAFAYNVAVLLTFVLAFAGMLRLARPLVGNFGATIAALLFTFWGFRWYGIIGHMNILIATALLPWMLCFVERACSSHRRARIWLALAGVLWALMIISSPYFVFLGGILLLVWIGGRALGGSVSCRQAARSLILTGAVALILSGPYLIWFARETRLVGAAFFDMAEVSSWDASLNSLPIPHIYHPVLEPVARWLYHGPVNEPGQANFGLLASLLALVGVVAAWPKRSWRPVLLVAGVGLLLALGLTLKWNGDTVTWPALRVLNAALWRVGHFLKPAFFTSSEPPAPFDTAVPLPGMYLSALVPFWERARVLARYAYLASVGVFLLTALGLTRARRTWARVLLAGLLLFEVLPPPTANLPFPLSPHPAFQWLAEQPLSPGEAVIDLGSWQPDLVFTPIGGMIPWETEMHHKPTIGGASSVWPPQVTALDQWLAAHPHPFQNPEFVPLLRSYEARWILFHVSGGTARDMLAEARQNPALTNFHCFDPQPGPSPWDYPMCLIEIEQGK